MLLSECECGDVVKITNIHLKGDVFKKMLDMGFIPGTTIEVRKHATFLNDPIQIKVFDYLVAIRTQEAEGIEVK